MSQQQQQRISDCACRLPLPFDSSCAGETLGLFDQHHQANNNQPGFTSVRGNGSSFGGSPASGSMQNSSSASGGDGSVFTPDSRSLFSFASTPDPAVSAMNASASLCAVDLLGSSAMNEQQDFTAPLNMSAYADMNQETNAPISMTASAHPTISRNSRLPSLGDVREWTWRASSRLRQDQSTGSGTREDDVSDEEADQLLREFIALNTATVCAQHNIIGVADTSAMYSNYFRRSSLEGGQNIEGLLRLVETLESRMREISEIASRQVLAQARVSREAIGASESYKERMREVEGDQRQRGETQAEFFRTRYDLSNSLSDQV